MATSVRPGTVIFTGNQLRLAEFYRKMTGLPVRFTDDSITVLASETFELVIHALPGEPAVTGTPRAREDSYVKPFFPVASLAEAREKALALGGQLRPRNQEWEARGSVRARRSTRMETSSNSGKMHPECRARPRSQRVKLR
jgi:hypothetical protein